MTSTSVQSGASMVGVGYLAVAQQPAVLATVCGAGVVIVIWDPRMLVGGMAHCIFPRTRWFQPRTNYHADVAIPLLLKHMRSAIRGSVRYEAQLVGAGSFDSATQRHAEKLLRCVRKILARNRVPIVSEDTGGSMGRKIVFNTGTGEVLILKTKKIRKADWCPEKTVDLGRLKQMQGRR